MTGFDEERLLAAVLLVGHTGAKDFEVGFLYDDVPIDKADWWAKAQYQGTRITVEHHDGPVAAAEALAGRLLTSAKCMWCDGLITLNPAGAVAWPSAVLGDGSVLPDSQAGFEAMGQCFWRREGARWEPGCIHGASTAPKAPKNRADRRRLHRDYEASR
jgi:hypothetical protein